VFLFYSRYCSPIALRVHSALDAEGARLYCRLPLAAALLVLNRFPPTEPLPPTHNTTSLSYLRRTPRPRVLADTTAASRFLFWCRTRRLSHRRAQADLDRAHRAAVQFTATDGSGTRANRSDHRNHYNAIYALRWLPERAFTTPSHTTARLADAAEPGVQWAFEWYRVQRDVCPDSPICFLRHAPTATGEQVRVGTASPSLPAGSQPCQQRPFGPSISPFIFLRLYRLHIWLL
jgi:hypothetical protein